MPTIADIDSLRTWHDTKSDQDTRLNRTTDPDKERDLDRTFWRKAKAAMLTVRRYSISAAKFAGWSVGTAAGLATLFPAEFAAALQLIQRILGSVSWL